MSWSRIDDYYRIRDVINGLVDSPNHCGLCYQPECDHQVEKIDYRNALIELNTWCDVALQEYPGVYLEVGEVANYPSWPIGQEFNERFDYSGYRVFPKIEGGVFGGIVAHDNTVTGYNPDLTINNYLTKIGRKIARFGAGMYWGYGYNNEFYVVRLFRQSWQEIRRKSLPYRDVTGLVIPDFEVDFEISGYHFIPHTSSNFDFQTKYFEL